MVLSPPPGPPVTVQANQFALRPVFFCPTRLTVGPHPTPRSTRGVTINRNMLDQPSTDNPLTNQDVLALARLARLDLPPARAEWFRQQLGAMVGYVARLSEVNVDGVNPPTARPLTRHDLRADEPSPTLELQEFLALAPQTHERYVKLPPLTNQ